MGTAFGDKLKMLREKSGLSMKEVEAELLEHGFDTKSKTIYGYENGGRMPNADLFIALCEIYKCGNFMEEFSDTEFNPEIPNDSEWEIIQKSRCLDAHGHKVLDTVLDLEYERCFENKRIATDFGSDEIELVARNNSLKPEDLEKFIDAISKK